MPTAEIENLKEFRTQVREFADRILIEDVAVFIRVIAFTLLKNVIAPAGQGGSHPVDTGHARNNWQLSITVPKASIIPLETQLNQEQIENRENLILGSADAFSTIWLVNNVNYIGFLENGTDKIEPFKMLAKALAKTADEFPE